MKLVVLTFIWVHYFFNIYLGIRLKGLGVIQRFLRKEFTFTAFGSLFLYDPHIRSSYDYLLIGKSNEPETHRFLSRVIPFLDTCNFIDVGASVGEFVIGLLPYKNIEAIYAFEPRPRCVEVLKRNALLNNDNRVSVFQNVVGHKKGEVSIVMKHTGSVISEQMTGNEEPNVLKVERIILDATLPKTIINPIILIDVEGFEPDVLRGASDFIKANSPLIIFEYNTTSKRYFNLDIISDLIGSGYTIFRMKHNGFLDKDFTNSWNCVAVPQNSVFERLLNAS